MIEFIIASVIVLIILISMGYLYFAKREQPAPAPVVQEQPAITYTKVVAATPETAGAPALPGTTIISTPAGVLTQYGDETPVSADEDEHFQPYMSVLTNDMYRSDAAFDNPLGKKETEIYGNYYY